jgi:hypothetical protein
MIQKGNPLTVIGSAGYINNIKSKFFLSPYESLNFFSSRNYFDYTYSYASATSYLSTTVTPSVSNKVYISNWGMWSDNMVGVKLYLTNNNNALIHVCDLTWETAVYDNTEVVPHITTLPLENFRIRRNCDYNGINYRHNIQNDDTDIYFYPNGYPVPSIPNIDSNNPDTDFTRKRNYTYKYESTITDFNPEYLVGYELSGHSNKFYNYTEDIYPSYPDYSKNTTDLWVAAYFLNYNTTPDVYDIQNVYVNGILITKFEDLLKSVRGYIIDSDPYRYNYFDTALLNNFEYKTLCKHNEKYSDLNGFRRLTNIYGQYSPTYTYTNRNNAGVGYYLNDVLHNTLHDYPLLPTTVGFTNINTSVFKNQSSLTKYLFEFESSTKFIVKSGSEILGDIDISSSDTMNTTVVYSTFNNKYTDYLNSPSENSTYKNYGTYRMTSGVESLGFCYDRYDNIYIYNDIKQHIYIPFNNILNLFKDDTGWYFEQVYKNVIQIPCFAKDNGTILKAIEITINNDLISQGFSVSVPVFISSTKDNNNFIYEYVMRLDMPASAVKINNTTPATSVPTAKHGAYYTFYDVYIPATYVLVFMDIDGNEFRMKAIDIVV